MSSSWLIIASYIENNIFLSFVVRQRCTPKNRTLGEYWQKTGHISRQIDQLVLDGVMSPFPSNGRDERWWQQRASKNYSSSTLNLKEQRKICVCDIHIQTWESGLVKCLRETDIVIQTDKILTVVLAGFITPRNICHSSLAARGEFWSPYFFFNLNENDRSRSSQIFRLNTSTLKRFRWSWPF